MLNCAWIGNTPWVETDNIHIIEEGKQVDQKVTVWATQIMKQHKKFRNLANSDWVKAQGRDPAICHVIDWIHEPKDAKRKLAEYLGNFISDYDKHFYATCQEAFIIQDNLLYIWNTPSNSQDSALVFVVPMAKQRTAIDICHQSTGHQGWDHTLSLMKEGFWWPGMSQALLKVVANCGRCMKYKAKGQLPQMQPIICTQPMELVHIDYVGMEVTVVVNEKPVVKNILVVVDHFTQYIQVYVTKNHMELLPECCTTTISRCRTNQRNSVGMSLQ